MLDISQTIQFLQFKLWEKWAKYIKDFAGSEAQKLVSLKNWSPLRVCYIHQPQASKPVLFVVSAFHIRINQPES